jgi:predicted O-methyltransferase YrrM
MPETLTAVDISKALAIKGYMQPAELEWLANQATTHERIAEIGAYYGRSTRALCDHAVGKVHTYDDFYGPRDLAMDWRTRGIIREVFDKNLADHLESGLLIVHDEDHETLEPLGLFDMIFIDGSHEYFDFKHDLEIWIPHITEGGMLCGHDYDIAYPGILRALAETFAPNQTIVAPNTTIWYAVARGQNDSH